MEPTTLMSYACAFFTAIQGVAACFQIKDRVSGVVLFKGRAYLMASTLVVGAVLSGGLTVYLHDHPITPAERTATDEKPTIRSCPSSQPLRTGPATARGAGSIAHSGSDDTYNLPAPPTKPSQ